MFRQLIVIPLTINSIQTVNEICFHPKEPWILLGYGDGVITIWTYTTCTKLAHLEEAHHGGVQTVDFHVSCSVFASGGCDGKIKVWDYDETCRITNTFELEGHGASVNDVKFHYEFPWLVSASDDCTVRLWDWLSRSCIAVLSEHLGPVTSASFHPRKDEDLILSASLDGVLRIWDVGGLNDKSFCCIGWLKTLLSRTDNDVRLKNVLKGHKTGVVSAIFHPTLPFIFSASNDGNVYWWKKIGETCVSFKHQPLHLKTKAVSCLAYSNMLNAVMSTPDCERVSLLDASSSSRNKRIFKISEQKNFSCLSTHPTKNIFAISHSQGMSLYKVIRPPPGFAVINNLMYLVKDKSLLLYDYSTMKEAHVILGPINDLPDPTMRPIVVTLSCNAQGNAALISFDSKGYMLVHLNPSNHKACTVAAKGDGLSSVFVAPDRFAVLIRCGTKMTKVNILSVRTLANVVVSESAIPCDVDSLSSYVGLPNHLLCKATNRVVMFDLQKSIVVAELSVSLVRHIFWANYKKSPVVALVGEHYITMADEKLLHKCTVNEEMIIESGAWDEENEGVFIYKTWKHIKYCLVNGQSGTIMMFNEPLYITRASGNTLYCLDEGGKLCEIAVDSTEFVLQSSILSKDYMKQCCLCL